MADVEIYGLLDPESGRLRYVGKAKSAGERLGRHIRDSRRRNTPVMRWVRGLADAGLAPDLIVLDVVPDSRWDEAERYWIARARERVPDLLNVAAGGVGPFVTREQRSASARKYNWIRDGLPNASRRDALIHRYKRGVGTWISSLRRKGDLAGVYNMLFRARIHGAMTPEIGLWAESVRARL